MKNKIPYSEAKTFAEKICNHIPCKSIICGSIRREAPMIGDIDIAVEDLESVDAELKKFSNYSRVSNINKKFDALIDGIQFNFYRGTHGAMLLFLTGNYQLNIHMRIAAKRKDLKLNQYGLWNEYDSLLSRDEEEIFTLLDLEYLLPTERNCNHYEFGTKNFGARALRRAYSLPSSEEEGL